MPDLFSDSTVTSAARSSDKGDDKAYRPLADRLRPKNLNEVVGQAHILGPGGPLGRMVSTGHISSTILWGPPGTGKTTIARLLAGHGDMVFEQISAIFSGVADLKKLFARAVDHRRMGKATLLFVDEIHRFNKSQQDGFLPYVEDGTVTLIGATTENPSFELNGALLSRMQVLVLNRLGTAALDEIIERAEAELALKLPLDQGARVALKAMADGDGRYLLNCIERIYDLYDLADPETLDVKGLARLLQKRAPDYDKNGEEHYNMLSAFHKSLRGSDVDAALYWAARMLGGGEDPMVIIRRMTAFASEDVGMADPNAVLQALAAKDAFMFLGQPEGELQLAQAICYLATAPKSNSSYMGMKSAKAAAKKTGSLMPPQHAVNAPTSMMKNLGYGKGYQYDHDTDDGFAGLNYFPDGLERTEFYQPVERGYERDIIKRLQYFSRIRNSGYKDESGYKGEIDLDEH